MFYSTRIPPSFEAGDLVPHRVIQEMPMPRYWIFRLDKSHLLAVLVVGVRISRCLDVNLKDIRSP